MPAHVLDFEALNSPEAIAWRLELATDLQNALAQKIMRRPGSNPSDLLAVLIAATTDAASVVCVTEPMGYENAARLFSDAIFQRIMQRRERAESNVATAYTLRQPKPPH